MAKTKKPESDPGALVDVAIEIDSAGNVKILNWPGGQPSQTEVVGFLRKMASFIETGENGG